MKTSNGKVFIVNYVGVAGNGKLAGFKRSVYAQDKEEAKQIFKAALGDNGKITSIEDGGYCISKEMGVSNLPELELAKNIAFNIIDALRDSGNVYDYQIDDVVKMACCLVHANLNSHVYSKAKK